MPNPILDAARQRLLAITAERAALDREERELRAMVAAGEGAAVPAPAPVFPWPPTINPSPMWPPFIPAPTPFTPWIVGAPHGGMCACPRCCPPWTLGDPLTVGDGWTSTGTTIYVGDVNPSAGSVMTVGAQTIPTLLTTSQN